MKLSVIALTCLGLLSGCGDPSMESAEPETDCADKTGACAQGCGDGVIAGGEACDDGNIATGDGCDASCQLEVAVCGDSVAEQSEACDDGNEVDGDGCDSTCQPEAGFACSGSPSLCCIPEVAAKDGDPEARVLPLGVLVCASLSPPTDSDFFAITLPATRDVTIEISDESGPGSCTSIDPEILLYDTDGQTLVAYDDDLGVDRCSKIDPAIHPRARRLPPGTYYVRVVEYAGDMLIPSYTIRVETSLCGDGVREASEECDGTPDCSPTCTLIGT